MVKTSAVRTSVVSKDGSGQDKCGEMVMSNNYIPQTENLSYLIDTVEELSAVCSDGSRLKDEIVDGVDTLIRRINTDAGITGDRTEAVSQVDVFLQEHGDPGLSAKNELSKVEELREQNRRLKALLRRKVEYKQQVVQLNSEYEDRITEVMLHIRQFKDKEDKVKFQTMKECFAKVEQAQEREFEAYHLLVRNEEVTQKLAHELEQFYEVFDKNRANDIKAQTLASLLKETNVGGGIQK